MPSAGSGSRIPPGGTEGQILRKKSSVHYDLKWDEPGSLQGEQGERGPKGDTGDRGPAGAKGDTGVAGSQGPKGDTGSQGPKGDTGATGTAGAQGPKGDQGLKGDTGSQGPAGAKGDTGTTGAAGQGVPTGGTAGQVLTKNSATNYDTAWSTPASSGSSSATAGAPGANHYVTQRWYSTAQTSAQSTNYATVASRTHYIPVYFPRSVTVATWGVYVSSITAGCQFLFSMFKVQSNGAQPGEAIAGSYTVMNLSSANTGGRLISASSQFVVPAGWNFVGFICNSPNPNISHVQPANFHNPMGALAIMDTGGTGGPAYYTSTGNFTDNPSVLFLHPSTPVPIVWFQVI